jgi:hypothetical protein
MRAGDRIQAMQFDGYMHQAGNLKQTVAVIGNGRCSVSSKRDNAGVSGLGHPPDMKIGNSGDSVQFDGLPDNIDDWGVHFPVDQYSGGIFEQSPGPAYYQHGSHNPHERVEEYQVIVSRSKKGDNREDRRQSVGEYVHKCRLEVEILMVVVAVAGVLAV